MQNNEIELLLDGIVEYLSNQKIEYSTKNRDGRVNSADNEDQIIESLKMYFVDNPRTNDYRMNVPSIREWYDFSITKNSDKTFFVPVNIKVTRLQVDNLNCKLGIFYALTGVLPSKASIPNESRWSSYFDSIHKYINTCQDKDYYFLVANKNNPSDFFWNSLKQLKSLVPNGNNLPFQTDWADNRQKIVRTHSAAGEFILSTFKESIIKRAKILDEYNMYLEQHLQDYIRENRSGHKVDGRGEINFDS